MNKQEYYAQLSRVKKRKMKILKVALISLAILIVGFFTFSSYASWKLNEFMNKTSDPLPQQNNNDQIKDAPEKSFADEPFALLLVGEDYRPETGSMNTDAIIVSVWNPKTKDVKLLSIPRDTKVQIPNYGEGKINSVYAKGEAEKRRQEQNGEKPTIDGAHFMMDVLSDYLDIPILYYAKVDFQGFEYVIDELDGIKIDVERDMRYISTKDGTNINLKKGLQTLNGKQALDYARFRKSSDGNDSSDFERNERHQKIIKSFVDKLATFKGISNVFDILDIAGEHIKTNLSPKQMKSIFWEYKSVSNDDVSSISMESYWSNPYVYIEVEELERVKSELQSALQVP